MSKAAAVSRTIRYQQTAVHDWVRSEKGHLVGEFAFMEVRPDAGTSYVAGELRKALALCEGEEAQLVHVRFGEYHNARQHSFMRRMIEQSNVKAVPLPPDRIVIDGAIFDPISHFQAWKSRLTIEKQDHRAGLLAKVAAASTQSESEGKDAIRTAQILNEQGITTVNGKIWTGPNVRAFLKWKRSQRCVLPK